MRLLLLSDLHAREDWYEWTSRERVDLTAISGDLLDGSSEAGLLPQMVRLKRWADRFSGILALSSGNHHRNLEDWSVAGELINLNDRSEAISLLATPFWMDALERPDVVTDRRSQLLKTPMGSLVVTTIPFSAELKGPILCGELWEAGARLRKESGAPWLVLHHEPPAETAVGGTNGDPSVFYKIREYQPDYLLSGQPYEPNGAFADTIGRTWCFNPGFPPSRKLSEAKMPNDILLDTVARTAVWHASQSVGRERVKQTLPLT